MPSEYKEMGAPTEATEGAIDASSGTGLSDSGIRAMQGPSDADVSQEDQAIEALQQNHDIQPEAWQGLSEAERLNTLQNVEDQMAAIHGRASAEVNPYSGSPGECGFYDPDTNRININDQHLMGDPVREVVDTTVHEGRHAYQYYAVENPGFHDNQAEVEAWRENMQPGNYLRAEVYGQELYQSQPVEADAWPYGRRVTDGVYGEKE